MLQIIDSNTGNVLLSSEGVGIHMPMQGDFMMVNGIEYCVKKRLFGPNSIDLFVSQINPAPNVG